MDVLWYCNVDCIEYILQTRKMPHKLSCAVSIETNSLSDTSKPLFMDEAQLHKIVGLCSLQNDHGKSGCETHSSRHSAMAYILHCSTFSSSQFSLPGHVLVFVNKSFSFRINCAIGNCCNGYFVIIRYRYIYCSSKSSGNKWVWLSTFFKSNPAFYFSQL